jgi:hypothetical protein
MLANRPACYHYGTYHIVILHQQPQAVFRTMLTLLALRLTACIPANNLSA